MAQSEDFDFPTAESNPRGARGNGSDETEHTRAEGMQQSWQDARQKLGEAMTSAQDRSRQMMDSTYNYMHQYPMTALAIAAGIGVLVGWMLAQGSEETRPRRGSWW
jgi:ElaB/YqjD/DUF883 family membrane-anchored ribosome-binding protein